jgi:hypothetical protein
MLLTSRTVTAVSEKRADVSLYSEDSAISGFNRETDENCPLQDYYNASSGNLLPPFRDDQSVEDGTDRLYRNVGKKLPLRSSGVQYGIIVKVEKTEKCNNIAQIFAKPKPKNIQVVIFFKSFVFFFLHSLVLYRMCHEKLARLPFAFAFGYCINFCIYAMLRTRTTFS